MADSFNLTALAERLIAEGRLKPLAWKIKDALDIASAHTDLAMALETLDALDALLAAPSTDDTSRAATELALLNVAVVFYARATTTTSKKRKTFNLSEGFSPEEKVVHQELIDLRNHAIAHFGSGGSYRGVWQAEVLLLQRSPSGTFRVGSATKRQTMDKKLQGKFTVQKRRLKRGS